MVSSRSISGCSASSGRVQRDLFFAETGYAENVEHQHAVIGGNRAAALRDDGRMGDLGFVADILDVIDDVVRVFLRACS